MRVLELILFRDEFGFSCLAVTLGFEFRSLLSVFGLNYVLDCFLFQWKEHSKRPVNFFWNSSFSTPRDLFML